MQPPSFSEFQQLAMHGNVIPLASGMLADLLTPVSAYLKLAAEAKNAFLLESVEGGENLGRYSFLGIDPLEHIVFDGRQISVRNGNQRQVQETDIFSYLKSRMKAYRFVPNPELPRFSGGFVGFFGYDTVRLLEKLPEKNAPLKRPQAVFGLYETILAFDHLRHQIKIITNVILDEGRSLHDSYQAALEKIDSVKSILQRPLEVQSAAVNTHVDVQSNFRPDGFASAVRQAQEYITAGDIFQVVLSQQFSRKISAAPFDIYRALRLVNPSPYLYFLKNDSQNDPHYVIGSSPEMLVRVENGEVTVRPIAGTRPRGSTAAEDQRLADELLADEKECAEHAMLVDLGRNDVGRVAEYGSVKITSNMIVERYSHVMHIVSEVRGQLRSGLDAIDAFKAAFPAGTVSGAPKVRAMEIIEDLEPQRRGLYSGALGYIDFSGNLDTCITIRTIEVHQNTAYFQAGAGIVADSKPQAEYRETIHKSNAIRTALAMAEGGLTTNI